MAQQHQRLTSLTPKQVVLRDLEIARAELARGTTLLADEWSPKAVMTRSFAKHRMLWIGGAAVAGLTALKFLLPAGSHDSDGDSFEADHKEIATPGVLSLLKLPLMLFGKKAVLNYGLSLVQTWLGHHKASPSNDTDPTVV